MIHRMKKMLGAHLRELRRARGMTQERLAEGADVHPTYIAKIEGGSSLPTLDVLVRIASVFDVPLTQLLSPLDEKRSAQATLAEKDVREEIHELLRLLNETQLLLARDLILVLTRRPLHFEAPEIVYPPADSPGRQSHPVDRSR